jgi:hypothetical protein
MTAEVMSSDYIKLLADIHSCSEKYSLAYRSDYQEVVAYQKLPLRLDTIDNPPHKYGRTEYNENISWYYDLKSTIRPVLLLRIRHLEELFRRKMRGC